MVTGAAAIDGGAGGGLATRADAEATEGAASATSATATAPTRLIVPTTLQIVARQGVIGRNLRKLKRVLLCGS